jgi:malate synthase
VAKIAVAGIHVEEQLLKFVNDEVLPRSNVRQEDLWDGIAKLIRDYTAENDNLLEKRAELQASIDNWHRQHKDEPKDDAYNAAYRKFLEDIGYIVKSTEDFKVTTENVDPELATISGPQLVVPVTNARFALNAANARWGSLYDAYYGTDLVEDAGETQRQFDENGKDIYNIKRGAAVVKQARNFLDQAVPLKGGSHSQVLEYRLRQKADGSHELVAFVEHEDKNFEVPLANPEKFVGFQGNDKNPSAILLKNNGLHIELSIDRNHEIGRLDRTGISDVKLESATTTIVDFEDSVATVDAEDKVAAYRNWLGLTKGDLVDSFKKNGEEVTRRLNPDRQYIANNNEAMSLSGRSVMLVRNVGMHMKTDAILDQNGKEIYEGIMDAVMTALIAKHDVLGNGTYRNSKDKSIYIVKPKLHGPEEVASTVRLFSQVEELTGLPPGTLKMGIMDEERRTSLNLKECIRAAQGRVVFINTGFLDRTGDEIRTSNEAGPSQVTSIGGMGMRNSEWYKAYEEANVRVGLATGLPGHAQIGKGMWAKPSEAKNMLREKIGHPQAGANTAWVPSPTLATVHAMHYHLVDVAKVQQDMAEHGLSNEEYKALQNRVLTIPITNDNELTPEIIQKELDNCTQGILGYVVRWVDQGIGCSTVPDRENVGLMEDRATLRIKSQRLANWLHHGIITEEQVMESMRRMAQVVDQQNAKDEKYSPMLANLSANIAFETSRRLVFEGLQQPNGYTEFLLNEGRRAVKADRPLPPPPSPAPDRLAA